LVYTLILLPSHTRITHEFHELTGITGSFRANSWQRSACRAAQACPERRLQVACRRVIRRQPAHHPVDSERNPLTAGQVVLRDRRTAAAGRLSVDGPHVHRRAAANHRLHAVAPSAALRAGSAVIHVARRDAAENLAIDSYLLSVCMFPTQCSNKKETECATTKRSPGSYQKCNRHN